MTVSVTSTVVTSNMFGMNVSIGGSMSILWLGKDKEINRIVMMEYLACDFWIDLFALLVLLGLLYGVAFS